MIKILDILRDSFEKMQTGHWIKWSKWPKNWTFPDRRYTNGTGKERGKKREMMSEFFNDYKEDRFIYLKTFIYETLYMMLYIKKSNSEDYI